MKINPTRILILATMLLALPAAVQAQFTFTTNTEGSLNLSGYTGPGGAVVIPATTNGVAVTSIGANAFQSCTTLTSVAIPTSVSSIGLEAFVRCTSLTNISVNTGSQWFSSINGVLFDREQYNLIDYPDGLTNVNYTVPGNVTNIDQYAFASCPGLTTITIPFLHEGPTVIGEFAFSGCTGLSSVTITNYYYGGGPTSIGAAAFAFCTNLTTVFFESNAPPDVGTAFYGDRAATVYYLLGTTGWGTTFGGAPTEGETAPSQFDYDEFDGSFTIERYDGPGGAVAIPASINGFAVTSLGEDAFLDSRATSVTIPSSVTNIGEYAFQNCTSLTNIFVSAGNPSYSSLKGVLFDKAQDTLVGYPAGLTNGTYLIPNSVTNIGEEAFYHCASLTNIIIPNSVTSIGEYAFEFCTSLTSLYFQGNAPSDVGTVFYDDPAAVVYYLLGTTGWGTTFGGAPAALWNPQATTFLAEGNQFGFNITGPTNTTVVVEACTNLANPVWLPVATNTLSSGTSSFSDSQWTNYPNRYYRFSAP